MRKKLGVKRAEKLQQRLFELRASESLEDMARFPAADCHELSQNRKGQISVNLDQPYRLIFVPDHDPLPTTPEGGLDRTQVTRILIVEIVNYHGK
jgi:proteic killer suppression protein